ATGAGGLGRDAILITYGDQFREPGRPPLQTLRAFLNEHLRDAIGGVHILPCFPYSSDDGFSVMDYRRVDPALGDWDDIAAIGRDYRLMFDFVANHVSRQSAWFQAFLRNEPPYNDYFIVVDPATDLSRVVRPRALPLLTPVETRNGVRHVWTTFSDDQIDLNYADPQVLLEMTDVLLGYVARGAEIIRLDAIAYLWKEIGTPCIHLPQTHAVVKLWRAVLDAVAPHVLLITETNVPHAENISYFGEPLPETGGTDEAQMVYNFSLAPLVLHALRTGDATRLTRWAADLRPPAPGATFFNFIASHDGIGVLPARGLLSEAEVGALVAQTLAHGGRVSYKANGDGTTGVYELNTTLYDFLNDPAHPDPDRDVPRFLASQAILLSLAGVPGIYVHSLFGSRNCHDCFAATGRARSLNRHKFDRAEIEAILADPARHERRVFDAYRRLLRLRRAVPAFHPAGGQQALDLGSGVFAVLRRPPAAGRPVLCLVNVSSQPQTVDLGQVARGDHPVRAWRDLIGGESHAVEGDAGIIELKGYQVAWLAQE
ncbi:MAG: alpha-amylase family glycosyl hydrolase, partial [Anaerolineae bacterium]